jgi:hypothetical protein
MAFWEQVCARPELTPYGLKRDAARKRFSRQFPAKLKESLSQKRLEQAHSGE